MHRRIAAFVLRLAVMVLVVLFGAAVPGWADPNAVIAVGPSVSTKDHDADLELVKIEKAKLEAAGYTVTVIDKASVTDVKKTLENDSITAFVFIGHGAPTYANTSQLWVYKDDKIGTRVLKPNELGNTTYNQMAIVSLDSCSQGTSDWSAKFPKATFYGCKGSITDAAIGAYREKNPYPKAGSATAASVNEITQDKKQQQGPSKLIDASGDVIDYFPNDVGGPWKMGLGLASKFGALSYNFYITDPGGGNPDFLFGADVSGGVITDTIFDTPLASPDFTIGFTEAAFLSVFADNTTLNPATQIGNGVYIDSLGKPLDPTILFDGVAVNVFNLPEPDMLLLFVLAGGAVFGWRLVRRGGC